MAVDPDAATSSAGDGAKTQSGVNRARADAAREADGRSSLYWTTALFACGLMAGILGLLFGPASAPRGNNVPLGHGCEMVEIAKSLNEHGSFGDPFDTLPTGPTAVEPPLYPLALALAFKLLKSGGTVAAVSVFAAILANALTAALLVRASKVLFGSNAPGVIAGVLSILAAQPAPCWDVNHTQLGLVLLAVVTERLVAGCGGVAWRGMAAGAMAGLIALLNPVSALASTACVAFFLMRGRPAFRDAVRFAAAFVVAAILVNLPWLGRNYGIWGEFIVRTSFGVTLHESNNDCAAPSLTANISNGCSTAMHPNGNVGEASMLARVGEPAYNRQKAAEAAAWIESHRARFAWLSGQRILDFWFPHPKPPAYVCYAVWAITILSIPGLVWMRRRREAAGRLLLAVFMLYPLAYYVVVSDLRYRTPILWLSCLAAGYFLSALLTEFGAAARRRWPRASVT